MQLSNTQVGLAHPLCIACRSVYLCVKKKVESKSLKLVLKGYEISEYDYQYIHQHNETTFMPKVSQRTAKKDVVKVEFKLVENHDGFSEGCYSYPFQYQLPHNIPGEYVCVSLCTYVHVCECVYLLFQNS